MAEAVKHIFRGNIFMVDFGKGEGQSVCKGLHPCVVVSNNTGNHYSSVVSVCLISTTRKRKKYPVHIDLLPNTLNKLKNPSTVMTEQIRTVGKDALLFKTGHLTDEEIHKVDQALRISLNL